jgi:NAD(P)-dependent dehydrogenase (short-subunit alcohol dehydrogenase family)
MRSAGGLLLHQGSRHPPQRQRQDHHHRHFAASGFTEGYSTYAGGKASVEDFTLAAAKEFAPRRISITAIGPGPMDTPFFYGEETPERVAYHKSQSMNGELTKIEDIVPIVRFLATERWWITG